MQRNNIDHDDLKIACLKIKLRMQDVFVFGNQMHPNGTTRDNSHYYEGNYNASPQIIFEVSKNVASLKQTSNKKNIVCRVLLAWVLQFTRD